MTPTSPNKDQTSPNKDQTSPDKEWLEAIPASLRPMLLKLQLLAAQNLETNSPYHSIRIAESHFEVAAGNSGRLPAWCISITTQEGWEYENATSDRHGTMWMMFKNPYVFS